MIPHNKVNCNENEENNEEKSSFMLYKKNNYLFPISYSIPEEKIIDHIPIKYKMISSLYPGDKSTYIYNTEEEYYDEYRKSIFAYTFKKGGWDCMRHYEILACGCIPYFTDIYECPNNILIFCPKI